LLQKLKTNPKDGISSDSIDSRTLAYGSNRKAVKILKSAIQLFIEACDDFTLKILIVAAIVSISAKIIILVVEMIMEEDHRATAWIEGFAILLAVFISSFITTVNNYQKQK
jgi:magnesium-transporting ATPase (P-type)